MFLCQVPTSEHTGLRGFQFSKKLAGTKKRCVSSSAFCTKTHLFTVAFLWIVEAAEDNFYRSSIFPRNAAVLIPAVFFSEMGSCEERADRWSAFCRKAVLLVVACFFFGNWMSRRVRLFARRCFAQNKSFQSRRFFYNLEAVDSDGECNEFRYVCFCACILFVKHKICCRAR